MGLRFFGFIECSRTVDCINDGNDAVNHVFFADSFIHKEGLGNRTRIGYAGSFNDDSVKVGFASFSSFSEFDQIFCEVTSNSAANAPVAHGDNFFVFISDEQIAVDGFFTELVFNNGDFLTVFFFENAV